MLNRWSFQNGGMSVDKRTVKLIQEFIECQRTEKKIINYVIRDDVFSLLQKECKVLYYSLEDSIEGCHVVKPVNGKMQQFVFINTSKVVQEQVWTAAHELGHVWGVDKYVRDRQKDCKESVEKLVGRFMAEFLMPERIIEEEICKKLKEYQYSGTQISVDMMIDLVAYLMNYFCVPFKSIILRFIELGHVKEHDQEKFLVYANSERLSKKIQENQYTRLDKKAEVYSIENIQRDIEIIEKKELFKESKLKKVRELFHLNSEETERGELEFKG